MEKIIRFVNLPLDKANSFFLLYVVVYVQYLQETHFGFNPLRSEEPRSNLSLTAQKLWRTWRERWHSRE